MPVYVYRCDTCGVAFEKKQAVTEAPLCDCPECDGHVRRVFQPVGVVFKGSGWYVTDSRGHKATVDPAPSSSSSSSNGNGNGSAAATPAAESKPAEKPAVPAAKDK